MKFPTFYYSQAFLKIRSAKAFRPIYSSACESVQKSQRAASLFRHFCTVRLSTTIAILLQFPVTLSQLGLLDPAQWCVPKTRRTFSLIPSFQLDKLFGLAMLVAASIIFLYYTTWTLLMVYMALTVYPDNAKSTIAIRRSRSSAT